MNQPPGYFGDNKRYYNFNTYLRRTFGEKICKLGVNGGFTCPNLDGTRGSDGCLYCSGRGGGEFAAASSTPIPKQIERELLTARHKWPGAKGIAYFQAFTNTYAPPDTLREKYELALAHPDVVGLSVATRPDALPDEVVRYLKEISKQHWLMVELGLQSIHEKTGLLIGRRHNYQEFLQGYAKLREAGVRVCVHLINSLPGETREMMLQSAKEIGKLRPHSIKLHMLYVSRSARIARCWEEGRLPLMAQSEYIRLVCDQLEHIPPEIVVQRLTGDGDAQELLAPLWTLDKRATLNGIDRELRRRNSWQGKFCGIVGGALP